MTVHASIASTHSDPAAPRALRPARGVRRPPTILGSVALLAALFAAGGCAYVDSLANRTSAPDGRIHVTGRDGMLLLSGREIPNYTCVKPETLVCERAGAASYTCVCQRP
jgi:hypothetical protein